MTSPFTRKKRQGRQLDRLRHGWNLCSTFWRMIQLSSFFLPPLTIPSLGTVGCCCLRSLRYSGGKWPHSQHSTRNCWYFWCHFGPVFHILGGPSSHWSVPQGQVTSHVVQMQRCAIYLIMNFASGEMEIGKHRSSSSKIIINGRQGSYRFEGTCLCNSLPVFALSSHSQAYFPGPPWVGPPELPWYLLWGPKHASLSHLVT